MIDAYLKLLEQGYYEVKFAFEGLADENVWKRPAVGLLSVGELAGHIAYWEAVRLAGEGGELGSEANGASVTPDLAKCRVSSLLIDHRFAYYPTTLATPPSDRHLAMTAEQVCRSFCGSMRSRWRISRRSIPIWRALFPDGRRIGLMAASWSTWCFTSVTTRDRCIPRAISWASRPRTIEAHSVGLPGCSSESRIMRITPIARIAFHKTGPVDP